MASNNLQRQIRRQLRRNRRRVESFGSQATEQVDQNFIRRLGRLANVRRFVITWIILIILLIGCDVVQIRALTGYYQHLGPAPGGVYYEGILGDFSNANPIYATNPVDSAVSNLIFPGLFTYNDKDQLVGDLALNWSVDSLGSTYTVHLRPNLVWQDGQPLTANDVLYTYHSIQSPDAESPLFSSWQGITVTAPDSQTIVFSLPNPLSSFPYSLTTGILPAHLLLGVSPASLRSSSFNTTNPIGAGPFEFRGIKVTGNTPDARVTTIEMTPFDAYWAGQPKLTQFVIKAFHDQNTMINSFQKGGLTAMSGLTSVPDKVKQDADFNEDNFIMTAANMVFFKTTSSVLSDQSVRQALVKATNTNAIIAGLSYPTLAVREPLLTQQLAFDPSDAQFGYDPTAAANELTGDGWVMGQGNIRYKNGAPLKFTLVAGDTPEYRYVTSRLTKMWSAIGASIDVNLQDDTTLQNSFTYHAYDALLYGISIGVDPDVFDYWDSSQTDPRSPSRLNLSEWKSSTADDSLEEGRTRIDPGLRVVKYRPFLQAWQQAAPALGLYQPRYLYITHGAVYGLTEHTINSDVGRYSNVENWEIHETGVTD